MEKRSFVKTSSVKVDNAPDRNEFWTTKQQSTRKLAHLLNYLQYVNLKIGAALIVLLDDVPDCLLHITIEGKNIIFILASYFIHSRIATGHLS